MTKPIISIATGCYNEELNLPELYARIIDVFAHLPKYDFELIIADNNSQDSTRQVLRNLCVKDYRVKAIFNTRNFGPERSGFNAILRSNGIAVIAMASDLQDPPEMILDFVKKWEEGYKIVGGIKTESEENIIMKNLRNLYYDILRITSYAPPLKNYTGFGIYDRQVIEKLREINDPNPFFRGLIAELGYEICKIEFKQPRRKRGITSYNLISLINHGILGVISQTQAPLRFATLSGFFFSLISFVIGLWYLIYKLIFWKQFSAGIAPLIVGIFFFASIQLFFVGILGEYIGAIQNKISKKLLVVENETINLNNNEKI
jgi:glycosyltransferase involved in cell wall biosynthesis